jgi:hypothetical protein
VQLRRMLLLAALATASLVTGCDDGGDATPVDMGPPPDFGVNPANAFPSDPGMTWTYRDRTEDWQSPPEPSMVASSRVIPGPDENEYYRETTTIIPIEIEGVTVPVRQIVRETYVITPPVEQVGPKVEFKGIKITEREEGSDRFVRELERTYLPPYTLIEDAWLTGVIANRVQVAPRMEQTVQLRGMEEPETMAGIVEVTVEVAATPGILPMECQYRDEVRKIEVVDDFTRQLSRTYWVQPGTGLVQWQFRDAENLVFTLMGTNLEPDAPACPAE